MAAYTFTPISTHGFVAEPIGFNNQNQILFNDGVVYRNGVSTNIIGPSGVSNTGAEAINNSGEVLAYDNASQSNYDTAFVEAVGGSPIPFAPPIPSNAPSPPNGYVNVVYVLDLNDSGDVLGELVDNGTADVAEVFPFLDVDGNVTLLLEPSADADGTAPVAVNNTDQVIGNYSTESDPNTFVTNGFLYSGGTWTTIDDPAAGAGGNTNLLQINNAGQILGRAVTSSGANSFFLYSDGQFLPISDPLGTAGSTVATGMNDSGAVVGNYSDASGNHGFLYFDGVYTTVDDPSATLGTYLYFINNSGDIFGNAPTSSNNYFIAAPSSPLFTTGADIVDFNNLTPAQQTSVQDDPGSVYDGLGGDDVVTLPSAANFNESVGGGATLSWSSTTPFVTGSQPGDTYTIAGTDGDYDIQLGAGTDTVTIDGNGNSVITAGDGTDTITINGNGDNTIDGGTGDATVSLSGAGQNTLIGNSDSAFASVTVGASDALDVEGQATANNLVVNADVQVSGALTITGELSGAGSITVDPGATLTLNASGDDGTVAFQGAGGSLVLGDPADFHATVKGFASGDTIDLTNVAYANVEAPAFSTSNNVLEIPSGSSTYDLQFAPSANLANSEFWASPDGQSGTDIKLVPDISVDDYLLFSQLAYDGTSVPFEPTVAVPGWSLVNANVNNDGFAEVNATGPNAVVYAPTNASDNELMVSFRGSVTSYDWLTADAQGIAPGNRDSTPFAYAEQYVHALETEFPNDAIFVTGHSLGAAEAEDVFADPNLHIAGGVTFAAPGVTNMLACPASLPAIQDLINSPDLTDYVISTDPIGTYTWGLAGIHVGDTITLPTVVYASSLIGTGVFGALAGEAGVAIGVGVSALLQHSLYSYGQALLDKGLINENPIAHPLYGYGDLTNIIPGLSDFQSAVDAAGNIIESGVATVSTALGSAVATISETLSPADVVSYLLSITIGSDPVTEASTITDGVVTSDQIDLNGAEISDTVGAAINVDADGSIVVCAPSSVSGDEVTIEASPTGDDEILMGGDSASAPTQLAEFSSTALDGSKIAIGNDGFTETSAGGAVEVSTFNIIGQSYTSTIYDYGPDGTLQSASFNGVTGQPYTSFQYSYLNGLYAGVTFDYVPTGQPYSSYNYDYSPGNDFIGSEFFYTGITRQAYTGEEIDYDGGGNVTRVAFTNDTVDPFSSYEYDYVGGVFVGSTFTYTGVLTGASYSSYEVDYDQNNNFIGDKFFFTDLPGQPYTGEEEDFDAGGSLARVLLTGMTQQAYSSLELDYSVGTYAGYKAYYDIAGQSFTTEEVDVSAANAITKVIYSGLSGTPYSSVEEGYSNGALNDVVYDFTNVSGASAYAYQVTDNANGVAEQETFDNNDGSHTIVGLANNQTFTSIGNDTFTGGGANETFVFNPVYGHDTITDFASYLTGAGHDTISLSTSEFANVAAVLSDTQNVGSNAVITAADGDTLTLDNVTAAMLSANQGDFAFHA